MLSFDWKTKKTTVVPTISFSLAAIIRTQGPGGTAVSALSASQEVPQYALVHERKNRGWWLPGGGIESYDDTPVDAAVRETMEEASSASEFDRGGAKFSPPPPTMTHLLSLEQTPGRMRFIFRGEWIDNSSDAENDGVLGDASPGTMTSKGVLKRLPGDEDSFEARWVTLDQVRTLHQKRDRSGRNSGSTDEINGFDDPWLRGHEPLTFFGVLHHSWEKQQPLQGIPVQHRTVHEDTYSEMETARSGPFGAFFLRIKSSETNKDFEMSESTPSLKVGKRAAANVYFRAHLLVLDSGGTVAVDVGTGSFKAGHVENQNFCTLRGLVDWMIKDFVDGTNTVGDGYEVGLLRLVHVSREGSPDAELAVYIFLRAFSTSSSPRNTLGVRWVDPCELADPIERALAVAMVELQSASASAVPPPGSLGNRDKGEGDGPPWSLEILRNTEEPRSIA